MEEHVDGVANKVECKKEKRATKRKINLENISLPPDQASSSTSIIRAGNIFGTVSTNNQSDKFKDSKMKRAKVHGPDSSTEKGMVSNISEVLSERD